MAGENDPTLAPIHVRSLSSTLTLEERAEGQRLRWGTETNTGEV